MYTYYENLPLPLFIMQNPWSSITYGTCVDLIHKHKGLITGRHFCYGYKHKLNLTYGSASVVYFTRIPFLLNEYSS